MLIIEIALGIVLGVILVYITFFLLGVVWGLRKFFWACLMIIGILLLYSWVGLWIFLPFLVGWAWLYYRQKKSGETIDYLGRRWKVEEGIDWWGRSKKSGKKVDFLGR